MKRSKVLLMILFVCIVSIVVSGCTKYVCYDGTEKKSAELCPEVPIPKIVDLDAGKFVDNYGNAVANAKGDQYTRVNLYAQNGSWYATGLFANSEQQTLKQVFFKIDGNTGDVKCISGCEYLNFKK